MFRIKLLSGTALAALSVAVLTGPALARGPGGHAGYFGGARYGGLAPAWTGSYLPYRLPGNYGLGGYGLGYAGYGLGYGGYSRYGLGYGGGALGLGLGLRYGLGGGYSGYGYGGGYPGYYPGSGISYPLSGSGNQAYPYTPLQPYGYNHQYGSGVYNYGGANPDFRQSMYAPPAAAPGTAPEDASAPAAAPAALPAREVTDVAHLQVIMPTADAQLWVNDTRTRQQGTERAFVSPSLRPGKTFAYEMRARWTDRGGQPVEQSRSITVKAGDRQVVDFTRPQAEEQQAPAPERLEEAPPRQAPQDRQPMPPPDRRPQAPQDRQDRQPPPPPPVPEPEDRPER